MRRDERTCSLTAREAWGPRTSSSFTAALLLGAPSEAADCAICWPAHEVN